MHTRTMVAALTALLAFNASADTADSNWPAWRGPQHTGAAVTGNPPTTWSETENVKWKVELPDAGDGTPIVWGDRVFLQTAVATKPDPDAKIPSQEEAGREIFTPTPTVPYVFSVMCFDRNTGETIWQTDLAEAIPHEGHHASSSFASYSPVTDGEHLWVSFGSRGLYCLDMDGNKVWQADLVEMLMFRAFGEGSSPALAGDAVIAVCDHEGDSKIFAFNKRTGDILWEKDREEQSGWATPVVTEVDGQLQVIASGSNAIRGYDAATGDLIWSCGGLKSGALPTPVVGNNMVYSMTGYQEYSLVAVELGHKGDLTGTDAVKWTLDKNTPYVPSPMLSEDRLYFTSGMRAALSCYNALTGEPYYETERLEGLRQMYSSPTAANGYVYIAGRRGGIIVLKDTPEYEVVSTITMEDGFDASPVVVGDEIFLRGEKYLYCIAEQ